MNPPVTAYTYALYFDPNGGTLNGASPVSMTTTSTTYSFPVTATATRDGYTFLGWSTDRSATTATYPAGSTITLTAAYPIITLYAVWQAKAPVVVSEDLIGNAVLKSVKQVNDRFSDMKNAVVSAVETVNKDNKYLTDAQLQQVKNIVNDMVKVYALCERALMYDWCLCGGDYSLAEYAARQLPVFLHDFLPETSSENRSEEIN